MADTEKGQEFHSSITAEERDFYLKAYPTPDHVRDRRTHCTTCKMHLGTAPGNIENIKMHPILRVTQCPKCQEFYNCGEFSKGEDGSELYCRWCGQGGEVYCCSNCPFVFCKSCITKNLSRGVVSDIESNENWRCFSCAPKIIWPLRAIHWALMNYIDKQKNEIAAMNISEEEKQKELNKDRSNCCRLAKAKCGNMSDSMDSIDSSTSKRSSMSAAAAAAATKKKQLTPAAQAPAAKRQKSEVVCTPDLMSMLEPDCQLTTGGGGTPKARPQPTPPATPKVMTVQSNYNPQGIQQHRSLAPPPLVLRNTSVQLRPLGSNTPSPVIRRTVVSPRTPSPAGSQSPVYHTINGYRIDLNSAAQQGTYRLPNGKLIQVKRQSAPVATPPVPSLAAAGWQHRTPAQSPVQRIQVTPTLSQPRSFVSVQQPQTSTPQSGVRYPSMVGSTVISSYNQNGPQIQMVNGGVNVAANQSGNAGAGPGQTVQIRPVMVRHTFANNAYGVARTQFQDQIFNAMEICQHLTGKIQTLTNSNAYKTAKNYLELKELYIHLSYLLTYAIGRFKGLQDKCLGDMRQLGFGTDADSLENGQLAADKQASDNEDDEIEIVEPKTDTITLDSDDESTPTTTTKIKPTISPRPTSKTTTPNKQTQPTIRKPNIPAKITPIAATAPEPMLVPMGSLQEDDAFNTGEDMSDFMSTAHTLLASMLEVDIIEGEGELNVGGKPLAKKQPRKKTTNKPNPTLLKQKRLLERQKMEELKKNDLKLKMNCTVKVERMDSTVTNYKEMFDKFDKKRIEWREMQATKAKKARIDAEEAAKKAKENAEEAANKANENAEETAKKTEEKDTAQESGIVELDKEEKNTEMEVLEKDNESKSVDNAETAQKRENQSSEKAATSTDDNPLKIVSVTSLDAAVVEESSQNKSEKEIDENKDAEESKSEKAQEVASENKEENKKEETTEESEIIEKSDKKKDEISATEKIEESKPETVKEIESAEKLEEATESAEKQEKAAEPAEMQDKVAESVQKEGAELEEMQEEAVELEEIQEEAAESVEVQKESPESAEMQEKAASESAEIEEETSGSAGIQEEASESAEICEETAASADMLETAETQDKAAESAEIQEEAVESAEMQEEGTKSAEMQEEAAESAEIQEEAAESADIQEDGTKSAEMQEETTESAENQEEAAESAEMQEDGTESSEMQDEAAESAKIQEEAADTKVIKDSDKPDLAAEKSTEYIAEKSEEKNEEVHSEESVNVENKSVSEDIVADELETDKEEHISTTDTLKSINETENAETMQIDEEVSNEIIMQPNEGIAEIEDSNGIVAEENTNSDKEETILSEIEKNGSTIHLQETEALQQQSSIVEKNPIVEENSKDIISRAIKDNIMPVENMDVDSTPLDIPITPQSNELQLDATSVQSDVEMALPTET